MTKNLIKGFFPVILIILFFSCEFNNTNNEVQTFQAHNNLLTKDQTVYEDSNNNKMKLNVYWASTDISVGENRIAFGLVEESIGPLKDYEIVIYSFYLSNNKNSLIHEVVNASYYEWPQGRGIYVANMNFNRPGSWGMTVSVSNQEKKGEVTTALNVQDESKTPSLNSKAPMSINKTYTSEYKLSNITSDLHPDIDLYSLTISDAIKTAKPLLIVFASPAYCITKTCGPQVDVLKILKSKYKDKMNFIHIDVYNNPDQIKGNLEQANISQVVLDWGLPSEPWTFLINSEGIIVGKYEGFADEHELEKSIELIIK